MDSSFLLIVMFWGAIIYSSFRSTLIMCRRGMGGRGAMTPEMMTQYDKDGNGELSVEERTAMREAMRAGGMRPAGATQ